MLTRWCDKIRDELWRQLTRLLAEVAGQAAAIDPLDPSVVTNLNVGHLVALCHHNTRTLVATDKRKLGWERPVAIHCVKVCVTDTTVAYVDEDLIGTWLLNWNFLVLNRTAGLLDNLSPLLLGNGRCHGEFDVVC